MNRKLLSKLTSTETGLKVEIWQKTLDIARFNEYYPEWCNMAKEIDDPNLKNSFIQDQWDTIPFAVLKEFEMIQYIDFDG